MRISILGGSGFLGTNLSKALCQENISFSIFDIQKSKVFPDKTIVGNICHIEDLKKNTKFKCTHQFGSSS